MRAIRDEQAKIAKFSGWGNDQNKEDSTKVSKTANVRSPIPAGIALMPTNYELIKSFAQPYLSNAGATPLADSTTASDVTSVSVSFLTNQKQIEAMLPPSRNLSIDGPPVVTVSTVYQGGLQWLAGYGYNLMLVILPVVHNGKNGKTIGGFLPVVWENMTEPILMGRELLGWPKIYADLPPARKLNDTWQTIATWHGFQFAEINVKNIHALTPAELQEREKSSKPNAGLISHKFILKTGAILETDADYLTISTNEGAKAATYREVLAGKADIRFIKGTWEQLPTMVHIVEKLADLEIKEVYDATIATYSGGSMGATIILE